jgi:hypothetical protein
MIYSGAHVVSDIGGDQLTMLGHSIGSGCGLLLTMDEAVSDFLQRSKAELRGLTYADITHADDRHANVDGVARLGVGDKPLRVRKRYILPQGGHVWATVQISRLETGMDRGRLIGTIFTRDVENRPPPPAALWAAAKRQAQLITERNAMLGPDLFNDGAWTVLLCLYLAEAEGRGIADGGQSTPMGLSAVSAAKWLRALRSRGLVEYLGDRDDQAQLTQHGLDRIENLLVAANTDPA